MRPSFLAILLATAASARPLPTPHNNVDVPRELEYAQLAGLSPSPSLLPGHVHRGTEWQPDHGHDGEELKRHPHDHGYHGQQNDIVDNIISFLSHEAREVPDATSRVVHGIVEFLSHETRDAHHHQREHYPAHHPHREHHGRHHARHPRKSVIKNIVDFFASAAR